MKIFSSLLLTAVAVSGMALSTTAEARDRDYHGHHYSDSGRHYRGNDYSYRGNSYGYHGNSYRYQSNYGRSYHSSHGRSYYRRSPVVVCDEPRYGHSRGGFFSFFFGR